MSTRIQLIVGAIIVLVIAAVAYIIIYKPFWQPEQPQSKGNETQSVGDAISEKVGSVEKPLEEMPAVNPIDQSNPYRQTKTNPFE